MHPVRDAVGILDSISTPASASGHGLVWVDLSKLNEYGCGLEVPTQELRTSGKFLRICW